jgi:hypothetical protein
MVTQGPSRFYPSLPFHYNHTPLPSPRPSTQSSAPLVELVFIFRVYAFSQLSLLLYTIRTRRTPLSNPDHRTDSLSFEGSNTVFVRLKAKSTDPASHIVSRSLRTRQLA